MPAEPKNKYAQEWTLENAQPRFEDALQFAENDESCLCLQDAIYYSGIPYSTFDYLAVNQEDLGRIKNDIKAAIIRRINRLALDRISAAPASAAIWRMKQLGERDEQHVVQSGTTKQEITVTDAKTAAEVEKMKEAFEKET